MNHLPPGQETPTPPNAARPSTMTPNDSISRIAPLMLGLVLMVVAGCGGNAEFLTEERLNEGMVVILPGVEGASGLNKDIRHGLVTAGIAYAMPIRDWRRPIPLLGVVINQVDFLGNPLAAQSIANAIMDYQDEYPDRPVYILGHSGGGGVAIFVAEGLDEDRRIEGVIVLSGSISSAYNLEKALSRTQRGIVNFYNRNDSALLAVATMVLGNVDGIHGPSAGLIGFDEPKDKDADEKKAEYTKLYQVEMTNDMVLGGGSHTAVTDPGFVSLHVAPWIYSPSWPATYARSYTFTPAPPEELDEPEDPQEADDPQEANGPAVTHRPNSS